MPGGRYPAAARRGIRTIRSFAVTAAVLSNPDELKAVFKNLTDNCRGLPAEDILLLTNVHNFSAVAESARQLADLPVNVQLFLIEMAGPTSTASVVRYGSCLALRLFGQPLTMLDRVIKRAFDVLVSAISLVALFPLFVLVAAVIKLEFARPCAVFTAASRLQQ